MLTSVRAKRFTGCSGETSLDLSKCFLKDRLLDLQKMAVLLHEVAAATVDHDFLHHFCIISCVKPHYFRSCILAFTVALFYQYARTFVAKVTHGNRVHLLSP